MWLSNQKNRKAPIGPFRTLLVVKGRSDEPMVVLASEWDDAEGHLHELFDVYMRRWDAEEANRAMKDSRGWGVRLEDLPSLKFVGVRRLVMLAACGYLFLAEMGLAGERVVGAVVATIGCFGVARDETYRLLRAVGAVLSRMPRWRLTAWTRGPYTRIRSPIEVVHECEPRRAPDGVARVPTREPVEQVSDPGLREQGVDHRAELVVVADTTRGVGVHVGLHERQHIARAAVRDAGRALGR